jgi:hypothetical protein
MPRALSANQDPFVVLEHTVAEDVSPIPTILPEALQIAQAFRAQWTAQSHIRLVDA